jgi:hypothetical protein
MLDHNKLVYPVYLRLETDKIVTDWTVDFAIVLNRSLPRCL